MSVTENDNLSCREDALQFVSDFMDWVIGQDNAALRQGRGDR